MFMKYDDVSWHNSGDYPSDLPPENAATHIGVYLAWCLYNGFASDELKQESGEDILKVVNGSMTGAQFLLSNCDGKFWDTDLSETGQAFTSDYYENNKSEFSKQFGFFFSDYCKVLDDDKFDSVYHYEDSQKNYNAVASVIDKRFKEWSDFKKIKKF